MRVVDRDVDRRSGDREDGEGGADRLLLAVALRDLDGHVRELAVFHDDADRRLVDLDLVDDELPGEEGEDAGAGADPVAREGGALAVRGVEAHVGELERERDELHLDRVVGVEPLLLEEAARLARGPGVHERRAGEESEDDREEADGAEDEAEDARHDPRPVVPATRDGDAREGRGGGAPGGRSAWARARIAIGRTAGPGPFEL